MTKAGVVAILPCGPVTGGVTSWAVRLLNSLAAERACGLVLHRAAPGVATVALGLDSRVRVFDLSGLKRLEDANGDVSEVASAYGDIAAELGETSGRVVLLPNLLGDCYGACAEVTREEDIDVRVIGWAHSDNAYDVRVIEHYESMLSAAVGVSAALAEDLRGKWGARADRVMQIPSGVEMGEPCGKRDGPLRIVYTGRLDEGVKRVSALVAMSDELLRRGVQHRLTLVGDGPAERELDEAIAARRASADRAIVRTGALTPGGVRAVLRESDVFVLASRYEGLSVSMLEAMSEGCCCVVTRVNSGAGEVIEDGVNGLLVSCGVSDGVEEIGRAFAERIGRSRARLGEMGEAARRTVAARFSIGAHARAVGRLIDEVAEMPARRWPADRRAAFTSAPGVVGSGTVPPGADTLLRDVLDSLRGRSVVVHGTGRHSVELAHVLRDYLAQIGAFIDEDPGKQGGQFLGRPVLAPDVVAKIGATDVVISSHLHQDAIWSRRAVYEKQGLRVHRLYAS